MYFVFEARYVNDEETGFHDVTWALHFLANRTLSATAFSLMTLSIMTLSIMTLSIMG